MNQCRSARTSSVSLIVISVDVTGTPVKTTVSVGIASTESFGYDLDALMRRADFAVYAAKQQGRNRVMVATPDDVRAAAAENATIVMGATASL